MLHEGFAIRPTTLGEATPGSARIPLPQEAAGFPSVEGARPLDGEPKPYGRGSSSSAMEAMGNVDRCIDHLRSGMQAPTTKGPAASRRQLWNLATKAGFPDPFNLEPRMIYAVMGALDLAGYRSSELYLDAAQGVHISDD